MKYQPSTSTYILYMVFTTTSGSQSEHSKSINAKCTALHAPLYSSLATFPYSTISYSCFSEQAEHVARDM